MEKTLRDKPEGSTGSFTDNNSDRPSNTTTLTNPLTPRNNGNFFDSELLTSRTHLA